MYTSTRRATGRGTSERGRERQREKVSTEEAEEHGRRRRTNTSPVRSQWQNYAQSSCFVSFSFIRSGREGRVWAGYSSAPPSLEVAGGTALGVVASSAEARHDSRDVAKPLVPSGPRGCRIRISRGPESSHALRIFRRSGRSPARLLRITGPSLEKRKAKAVCWAALRLKRQYKVSNPKNRFNKMFRCVLWHNSRH